MANLRKSANLCIADWSLVAGESVRTSTGLILHARRSTREAVTLKLVADPDTFEAERAALEVFAGRGSVRLIAAASNHRALLLERVEPGDPLSSLVAAGKDEAATLAGAEVARRLQTAGGPGAAAGLPALDSEAAMALDRQGPSQAGPRSPIAKSVVEGARVELEDLCSSGQASAVLHGDLHHDNILRAAREPWLAIDPKGRVGEPICEYAALVRNPIEQLVEQPSARPQPADRSAGRVCGLRSSSAHRLGKGAGCRRCLLGSRGQG